MKRLLVLWICLLATAAPHASASTQPSTIEGSWEGTLQVGATRLRIVFHLEAVGKGNLTGTMDSPDQGARGIPLSSVGVGSDTLHIEVRVVGGQYAGVLQQGDSVIVGVWSQGGLQLPLTLRRGAAQAVARRPQEPVPPFPYRQEEVSFASKDPDVSLAGTLTLPAANGPVPGVILISGSGPQDRDETVFGHRPFLVLADYLTRRGFAVLRYDDRGVGQSTGSRQEATLTDFVADALGARAFLARRPELDPGRIGFLGHSEGGLVASLATVTLDSVAFVVLLASPGLPGDELLLSQSEALARASGANELSLRRILALNRAVYDAARGGGDSTAIARSVEGIIRSWADSLAPEERAGMGSIDDFIARQRTVITSPWFRSFLNHDPRVVLREIRCPVLAMIGEKDLQVPPSANLPAIRAALTEAGNEHTVVRELPGLNHLFQTARTGLPVEYGSLEETIAPAALQLLGEWLGTVTTSPVR